MLQLNESIPCVIVGYIQKAIKAEREEDWAALEADRSLSAWVVGTLKRYVRGALSSDEGQFEVSEECDMEEHGFAVKNRRTSMRAP